MSINNRLITFAQQKLVLSHDETERNKIITSLEHFEKKLKDNFGNNIQEFVRFGSFTRNTILPREFDPESDVDLMVVFKTDMGVSSPGVYRKQLHDFVERVYPNSISKKDFPVVKLSLNHIHFDIVPAHIKADWLERKYYIPGKGDSWIETKPNDINKSLENANRSMGNNSMRNAIRLCKYWNASNGYPFESYPLEKRILNMWFTGFENTYDCFLKILNNLKTDFPNLIPLLDQIALAKGTFFTQVDEGKQWEIVKKLLPNIQN